MEPDRTTDDNGAEARRDLPRSRTPRATFSNPEAAGTDRRAGGGDSPPPVTFQPPPGAAADEPPARGPRKAAKAPSGGTAAAPGPRRKKAPAAAATNGAAPEAPPAADPSPGEPGAVRATTGAASRPGKATPAKATPTGAAAAKATPAKATPAKATPAKATPAKATPAKAAPGTKADAESTAAEGTATGATATPGERRPAQPERVAADTAAPAPAQLGRTGKATPAKRGRASRTGPAEERVPAAEPSGAPAPPAERAGGGQETLPGRSRRRRAGTPVVETPQTPPTQRPADPAATGAATAPSTDRPARAGGDQPGPAPVQQDRPGPAPGTVPAQAPGRSAGTHHVTEPVDAEAAAEPAEPRGVTESATAAAPAVPATPGTSAEPAATGTSAEPAATGTSAEPAAPVPDRSRPGVWARLSADPGHTPEVLALAAVDRLGPKAADWVARTRAAYPQADAEAIARLAVRRAMRWGAAGGALAAFSGGFAAPTSMAASAWTQATLVLEVAAAFGQDPADRARAADLLVLTGVHRTHAAAAAALAAEPRAGGAVQRLGMPVLAQLTGWFALRTISRLLPGSALLAATLGARTSAEKLGTRAIAHYREAQTQVNQSRGNRV
jgi:hypothetical protein